MVNWETTTLENVSANLVRGPFGGSLKKEIFVSSGYRVYEQQDAIYGTPAVGRYYISQDKYNELLRFAVADGDFIVSCSGTIGKIYRLQKNTPQGIINQALLKITVDASKIDPDFFLQYFQWKNFQQTIIDDTQGGAMKNLVGMDKFRKISISLPPLPEQRAIAASLSDVDALIAALEKLIAKKRAIKQGAMQELLTGKRRLSGFSGAWTYTTLGQVADVFRGNGLSKSKISANGHNYCILYGELFTEYTEIIYSIISKTEYDEGVRSKRGDILIPGSTTTTGIDLARASTVQCDDVLIGGDVNIIRPNNTDVDSVFLAFYITNMMKKEIAIIAKGITVYHLHAGDLLDLPLYIPFGTAEQTAIATILSDMDAEIDELTAKLNKLRNIKQGMMSELLTGRIRLTKEA